MATMFVPRQVLQKRRRDTTTTTEINKENRPSKKPRLDEPTSPKPTTTPTTTTTASTLLPLEHPTTYYEEVLVGLDLVLSEYQYQDEVASPWLRAREGEGGYIHLTGILGHPLFGGMTPALTQRAVRDAFRVSSSEVVELSPDGQYIRRRVPIDQGPTTTTTRGWDAQSIFVEPHHSGLARNPLKLAHHLLHHSKGIPGSLLPIQRVWWRHHTWAEVTFSGPIPEEMEKGGMMGEWKWPEGWFVLSTADTPSLHRTIQAKEGSDMGPSSSSSSGGIYRMKHAKLDKEYQSQSASLYERLQLQRASPYLNPDRNSPIGLNRSKQSKKRHNRLSSKIQKHGVKKDYYLVEVSNLATNSSAGVVQSLVNFNTTRFFRNLERRKKKNSDRKNKTGSEEKEELVNDKDKDNEKDKDIKINHVDYRPPLVSISITSSSSTSKSSSLGNDKSKSNSSTSNSASSTSKANDKDKGKDELIDQTKPSAILRLNSLREAQKIILALESRKPIQLDGSDGKGTSLSEVEKKKKKDEKKKKSGFNWRARDALVLYPDEVDLEEYHDDDEDDDGDGKEKGDGKGDGNGNGNGRKDDDDEIRRFYRRRYKPVVATLLSEDATRRYWDGIL
ncbi:MAG: hypothetical protein M1823_000728 [Watsoniomyces obsoletus]|nr:MAG: hypothetical protein M1823_000728 [Watsoniomyces obsoletus]